jgi:hypothetical protein
MVGQSGCEPMGAVIREFKPAAGPAEAYDTLDGVFTFRLPDGRVCVFDGRLDPNDQVGTFTVDGVDETPALWGDREHGGDSAYLGFLGCIDTDLDCVLRECADAWASTSQNETK